MRALVLLRNQRESLFAKVCTALRPSAKALFVTLCFWPCSMGSENLFLKPPREPRHPGMALKHQNTRIWYSIFPSYKTTTQNDPWLTSPWHTRVPPGCSGGWYPSVPRAPYTSAPSSPEWFGTCGSLACELRPQRQQPSRYWAGTRKAKYK